MARGRRTVSVALRYGLRRVAVRHHHDHRLRFARCDQVVHDDVGAPHRNPRVLIAAAAVQQVQHGIAGLIGLVAGRRVDIHAAAILFQRGRGVPHDMNRPVRDVLEIPAVGFFTGNHQEVVDAGAIALRLAVTGVESLHAVDEIPVAPQLRAERANGDRPDSGIVFGHLDIARSLPASVQGDLVRLGSRQAERHAAIRKNFGRDRTGCCAASSRCRLLRVRRRQS